MAYVPVPEALIVVIDLCLRQFAVCGSMDKALYHQTVVGSILSDTIAFTDFVPFSKVLKLDCLFPTHGCAEAFIL